MMGSVSKYKRIWFDMSAMRSSGFWVDLDLNRFSHNVIYSEAERTGMHERETSIIMGALLKKGDTVIDVGAHIGYFTLLASTLVGEQGRVFAFEPIAENAEWLQHHLEINRISNVRVMPFVVGDRCGETDFFFNSDNDGGHALWNVGAHPFNRKSKQNPKKVRLTMKALDKALEEVDLRTLKMIKIDAEGNELNVLKGARRILTECPLRCISWECNRFALEQMGHSEDQLRKHMYDLDYETMAFIDDTLIKLQPHQHVQSKGVFNLFFMPKSYVNG